MKRVRETGRKRRSGSALLSAAIVGYTNAGKSTLLCRLTDANVLAEDKLFATLDPTTRVAALPRGEQVLLTDTVGFIHKLPHQLVDAFRSTLEEAKYADFLIHVVDCADKEAQLHMDVVYRTLEELGISGKPVITVFNKADLAEADRGLRDARAERTVWLSAKHGGRAELLAFFGVLEEVMQEQRVYVEALIPYAQMAKLARVREAGQLLSEEYTEEGVQIRAYVAREMAGMI